MPSSLPSGFSRNVLANYSLALTSLVAAVISTPLLTARLGPERFGVWSLIGTMIPFLELLEFGFSNATTTFVARRLAVHDDEGVNRVLNTSFFLLMIPGLVSFAIVAGLAAILPHVVHIPPDLVGQARILLLLLGLDMAISIPGDAFGSALISLSRYDLLNASLIIVMVAQVLGWFVALGLHEGLVALGIITVAISMVGQVSRFLMVHKLLPSVRVSFRSFDRSLMGPLGQLSGWFSVRQLCTIVDDLSDVIIVGIVVNVKAAGVFAIGQKMATATTGFLQPATVVFFPHAAQLAGRGETEELHATVTTGNRVATGLALPLCLVVGILAHPAIAAWVGPRYLNAVDVCAILTVAVAVNSFAITGSTVISGVGEPRALSIPSAIASLIQLVLAFVMGHAFGIVGVAWGFLIVSVVKNAVLVTITSRRFKLSTIGFLASVTRAHVLAVLAAGTLGWYLAQGPVGNYVASNSRIYGVVITAFTGLALLIVYEAVFFVTGLTTAERRSFMTKVLKRPRSAGDDAAPV